LLYFHFPNEKSFSLRDAINALGKIVTHSRKFFVR
jgi:hypothetical protein